MKLPMNDLLHMYINLNVNRQKSETPEDDRRTYRPKRNRNNNKDEDNSPKTFNDKNHQGLS